MRDDFPWGWLLIVLIGGAFLIMFGGSGGGGTTNTNSHNNNQTHVLSDNKVASDNKLYVFSKVQECNAPGSCTTTNTNEVRGDRNTIIGGNGDLLCRDEETGIYSDCEAQP
jgi:hypothetical protein